MVPLTVARAARWYGFAVTLLGLVAVYPLLRTAVLTLFDFGLVNGFRARFIGIDNFVRLYADSRFWNSLVFTLMFALVTVTLEFVIGFGLALAVQSMKGASRWIRTALAIPWTTPTAVAALVWVWLLNDQFGIVNRILTDVHLIESPIAWLGSPGLAIGALIVADVWKTVPFVFLILYSGIGTIPEELYEAMAIDGGGFWAKLRYVTWPVMRDFVFVALIFRTIQAFAVFDLVYVMTGGGPGGATESISVYAYRTYMRYLEFGYGATIIVSGVAALALVSSALYVLLVRRHEYSA